MKTGKLIKFHRPGGDIHAYVYREGGSHRASLYVPGRTPGSEPVHVISGPGEEDVEAAVREWVDRHFPRSG